MKEDNIKEAVDPLTGELFIPKRNNQIFAARQNQIRYNNLKAAKERQAKAKSRKILDTNRKVLQSILGPHSEIIKSLDYIDGAGLDFGYNTHTIIIQGVKWICIYDYAYTLISANTFKIIKINT